MKRSGFKPSSSTLKRSYFKRRARKKRSGHDKPMLTACRGEDCYLAIDGICRNDIPTVVPCHANWSEYGKGMGIKANDEFTVPGCMYCHRELDQGMLFTREQKRSIWESAYERWLPVRSLKMGKTV